MSDWWTDFDDEERGGGEITNEYIETDVAPCGFCGEATQDHMILLRFADGRPVLATELVSERRGGEDDYAIDGDTDWSGSRIAWGRVCSECYDQLAFGERVPVMGDGALAIARGLDEQALEKGEIT